MKYFILAALMLLTACQTQNAFWVKECYTTNRLTNVGLATPTYRYSCTRDQYKKASRIKAQFGAWAPQIDNTFYVDDGMKWFDPSSKTYSQDTFGLTPVVFPFDSQFECQQAGKCNG